MQITEPSDPLGNTRHPLARLIHFVAFVVITGTLYFGREVLIPLALAGLLSFLLAPAVQWLERWKFPRVISTSLVSLSAFAVIFGVLAVAGTQLLSLAGSLPEYKDNIRQKISVLQSEGNLSKASRVLDEISEELAAEQAQTEKRSRKSRPAAKLQTVRLATPRATSFEVFKAVVMPLIAPLGTAAAVMIFTFVMLLQREDLRNRLIHLVGKGQLSTTTHAFEDAATRVSSYLRMQLIVNLSYGLPVGLGLYWIGVPNAPLWGMLAAVLRFVPYLGPMIGAAMPIALAFAISEGWTLVLWTLGLFVVLELISNNIVEPWLYGPSTGLSAIALMFAAIFWTWLWGAVGLLLATPLTVCLVVMGRYVPQVSFLYILLGDEPVLTPAMRAYQRLISMDWGEAASVAESHVDEHGAVSLYETVLVPALDLLETDRHADGLSEERRRFVLDSTRRMLEDTPERLIKAADGSKQPALALHTTTGPIAVCIVPAREEADELVALMLQQLLNAADIDAELLPIGTHYGDVLEHVSKVQPKLVCLSAFAPSSVLHASALSKRLRRKFPDLAIFVAPWQTSENAKKVHALLKNAGATEVVETLGLAVKRMQALM